jgi:predicted DsbA family dithiol-disulfide isomerase
MVGPTPVTLDLYADIACPWCYLGEVRLARALAEHPELEVRVRWQPFQLQPQLPLEGAPWRDFAERKFGGWERALAAFAELERAAQGDGLAFDFTGIARANNTADAHRLVLFAEERGAGLRLARDLFRAYFEAGQDLNDRAALLELAEGVGLARSVVDAFLAGNGHRETVAVSQRRAADLGVTGVPFYVFSERYALSGAQPVAVLRGVLAQLSQPQEVKI